MSNATILTGIATQATTLTTALATLDADPTDATKKTAALVAGETVRVNAKNCLQALFTQRKATAALAIAALLDDVPHIPVSNLEDHAITVTTLRSTYGNFFDVAYNASHGLTPAYGYDPDAVLASFRLLGSRFASLQTLCLAESGLDLSTVPLVS
jgi:hypothetical protein